MCYYLTGEEARGYAAQPCIKQVRIAPKEDKDLVRLPSKRATQWSAVEARLKQRVSSKSDKVKRYIAQLASNQAIHTNQSISEGTHMDALLTRMKALVQPPSAAIVAMGIPSHIQSQQWTHQRRK